MRPDESLGPKFLVYHDVLAAAHGDEGVARARFEAHVATIAETGHRFVSMSAFLSGEKLGPRDVVVTIDDGARSVRTVAWPILREHGAIPTLFILTGFMGLVGRGVEFVTWGDVAELAAEGVEIGCHGVSHVPLDQVEPQRMRNEIVDATAALREHGFAPQAFAYPFGRFDASVKAAVRDSGFEAAFSVMGGGADRFEIRRRLLTGLEGPTTTRFVLSDAFFTAREAMRAGVPRRFLKLGQPGARERWGPEAFGVGD